MEYMLFPNKYKEWILELNILLSIGENRCIQEIGKENVLQGKIWHKWAELINGGVQEWKG